MRMIELPTRLVVGYLIIHGLSCLIYFFGGPSWQNGRYYMYLPAIIIALPYLVVTEIVIRKLTGRGQQ